MKLAEALILRADLKTRAAQLRERLRNNAKVQEGETPAQDPQELLRDFEEVAAQTLILVQQINRTNSQTPFEDGPTLADALALRDVLKLRAANLRDLIEAASFKMQRYGQAEIKTFATVDVRVLQKQSDDLSKQLRELDTKIQALNWTVDIVE
ncbi:hypothetical protein IAD21_02810 [Abditibacteriota bacterium]|nr:hypothetical protein IAD21_02810 [Abditibacteriota bacterium]